MLLFSYKEKRDENKNEMMGSDAFYQYSHVNYDDMQMAPQDLVICKSSSTTYMIRH